MKKVSIIGAGFVGATTAQRIAEKELADVMLVDIVESVKGKALDLLEAAPVEGHDADIKGTTDYADIKGSDIVVITAGIARKPGMSREDLLETNKKIVGGAAEKVKELCPKAIIIVVTNPLDVMSYLVYKKTGFPKERVIGMAGILDSTRFCTFIAEELDVSKKEISAMVMGSHGDTMVPLPKYTTVSGIPITELMKKDRIDALVERTRKGGGEIVKYLGTGSAYYAPASSIARMVESIIKDNKRIVPAAAYLEGEYGLDDLYMGVPIKLGAKGLIEIVELKLDAETKKELENSAKVIKENIKKALE